MGWRGEHQEPESHFSREHGSSRQPMQHLAHGGREREVRARTVKFADERKVHFPERLDACYTLFLRHISFRPLGNTPLGNTLTEQMVVVEPWFV